VDAILQSAWEKRPYEGRHGRWDMVVTFCRFCGLGTDLPHETQEACIAALNGEIARMRKVVSHLRVLSADEVSGNNPNPHSGAEDRL
jgi:hypothetical protein